MTVWGLIVGAAFLYGYGRWHHEEMGQCDWSAEGIIKRRIS